MVIKPSSSHHTLLQREEMAGRYTKLPESELRNVNSPCDLESNNHTEDCSHPPKGFYDSFQIAHGAASPFVKTLAVLTLGIICFLLGRNSHRQEERRCLDTAWGMLNFEPCGSSPADM